MSGHTIIGKNDSIYSNKLHCMNQVVKEHTWLVNLCGGCIRWYLNAEGALGWCQKYVASMGHVSCNSSHAALIAFAWSSHTKRTPGEKNPNPKRASGEEIERKMRISGVY